MNLVLVQPQLRLEPGEHNLATITALVEPLRPQLGADDVVLLPEHWTTVDSAEAYEGLVRDLAHELGCHVVGGSHHQQRAGGAVNTGTVFDGGGRLVGRYEKLRPYADERQVVRPGGLHGELVLAGRRVLVLICSDFWFADVVALTTRLPDLVLVPALSVTRKAGPEYSRALWRHLAIARAYEYGVYVGISDWGHPSALPRLMTSGVGGLADPTTEDPTRLFLPVDAAGVTLHALDFARLEAFRADRRQRGFFWKDV